ncbi:MAG: hypothetical protein P4L77_11640 [Sulfuriferula sp.]|nr:hypothetical protein [Sulfuriferula sp.]
MSEDRCTLEDVEAWSKKMAHVAEHGAMDVIERLPIIPNDRIQYVKETLQRHIGAALLDMAHIFPYRQKE